MYTIEENIPAPEKEPGIVEVLESLEVDQSVSIPLKRRKAFSATISANYHALNTKKFTVSSVGQPQGMARVWRTE